MHTDFEMREIGFNAPMCGCDLCFEEDYRHIFGYDAASFLPHETLDMMAGYRLEGYCGGIRTNL